MKQIGQIIKIKEDTSTPGWCHAIELTWKYNIMNEWIFKNMRINHVNYKKLLWAIVRIKTKLHFLREYSDVKQVFKINIQTGKRILK